MIRRTTQANALFSGLQTNYALKLGGDKLTISSSSERYGVDCNCTFSTCIYPSYIFNHPKPAIVFNVPGFYIGRYVIEALLQSTLECFYNQKCLDELKVYLPLHPIVNIIALDSSLKSLYFENSTVNELVDNLMIEQWNSSTIYENYYQECHPAQCTYTVKGRNNTVYIVNTLIGTIGGLLMILYLLIPQLVTFILYCFQQRTMTVAVSNN